MSKSIQVISGKVKVMERLKSSTCGNPRYSFVIIHDNGEISYLIKTKPNSQFGYSITNYEGKTITIEAGYYRNELALIDVIEK